MLIFITLLIILIATVYFWQKKVYTFWTDRGIPQLKPRFPVGTAEGGRNFVYIFDDIYKKYKGTTKYVGMYMLLKPTLLVIDEEVIKHVMVKDSQYTLSRGFYYNEQHDPLTANLFSIDGPKWRALRTKLTPTFTSGKIKGMYPIIVDIGEKLKQTMDSQIDTGETCFDMREMFARFTTDVIGSCAFGLECNSLKDPDAKFRKMGMKHFDVPRQHLLFQMMFTTFPNLSRKLGMKITHDDVSQFFIQAVNDTIDHRFKNNIKRNDFVDLMIGLRNENKSNSMQDSHMDGLSMNEIAAQCFVFFLAGFETSSTASSFTIYELARNQEVQDKLRDHINEVLKRHGAMTYEALKDMTYLEQCINEGMRRYPPLGMLNRIATQDYKLPFSDAPVPKGTAFIIPVYSIHNDPNNYPNPDKYDPDRFSPEEVAKRHPFAFLPFGDGPRNCIGERFGMIQAKIGMAYLIGNYRFRLNPETKPIYYKEKAFVLAPEGQLLFDVEKI